MYMTRLGLQSIWCPHNFKLIFYRKEFDMQEILVELQGSDHFKKELKLIDH